MGLSKTELFTETQNDLAQAARALAHPARVAIVQHLLEANTCINGDLVDELGLAQATISQHVRELRDIGIIQGTIEGNRRCYCINPTRWAAIKAQFDRFFDQYRPASDPNCC